MTDTVKGYSSITKKKGKSPGTIRSIRIEKAKNGFTVSCDHAPEPSKSMEWTPPEQYVFESAKDTAEFVEEALGAGDKD